MRLVSAAEVLAKRIKRYRQNLKMEGLCWANAAEQTSCRACLLCSPCVSITNECWKSNLSVDSNSLSILHQYPIPNKRFPTTIPSLTSQWACNGPLAAEQALQL